MDFHFILFYVFLWGEWGRNVARKIPGNGMNVGSNSGFQSLSFVGQCFGGGIESIYRLV